MVCSSCGFVVKEKIEETGPEWRAFSREEKDNRSRGGIPTSIAMHDMGLATVIGSVNKDASGKSLSGSMKATVERLRTWDSRSQVHEPMDRNLRQAFSELDRLSDKLSVSDAVVEKALHSGPVSSIFSLTTNPQLLQTSSPPVLSMTMGPFPHLGHLSSAFCNLISLEKSLSDDKHYTGKALAKNCKSFTAI